MEKYIGGMIGVGMLIVTTTTPSFAEDIIITASKKEESQKDLTVNSTIITKEDIENSNANDVAELLSNKGIGYIKKYPGTMSFGLRGFATDNIGKELSGRSLVLINGRRAGTGNLLKFSLDSVERVEIIKGSGSVLYGTAGIGGVVNIITKKAKDKHDLEVSLKFGSYGYREYSIVESFVYKNFDFFLSYSRSEMDDYETGDGVLYEDTGYDKKENISANIGYEFLENNRFGVAYNLFESDKLGYPQKITSAPKDYYSDKDNWSIDFILDGKLDSLSWDLKYFIIEDVYKSIYTTKDPYFMNTDILGSTGNVFYDLNKVAIDSSVTIGYDYALYEIEKSTTPKNSDYSNLAFFVVSKNKYKDFILSCGLRYDSYRVDMKDDGGTERDSIWTSNIGLAYNINDALKIRANYGQGYKAPTAKELAGDYNYKGKDYVGNSNLKPESSDSYEIGLDYANESMSSSLTYFLINYKDKIYRYTMDDGKRSWENKDKVRTSGIEFDVSCDLDFPNYTNYIFKPYFSGTIFTEMKDKTSNNDLEDLSKYQLNYGVNIETVNDSSINVNAVYTGKQLIDADKDEKSDAFTIVNINAKTAIYKTEKTGGLYLNIEVNNLMDKTYAFKEDYPMPGRTFFLGVTYKY